MGMLAKIPSHHRLRDGGGEGEVVAELAWMARKRLWLRKEPTK